MADSDNFRSLVASAPDLLERWNTITDEIIRECEAKYGETLDRASLAGLTSVRLATLTGDEFDWRAEAQQQLPALKRAAEYAAVREKVQAEDAAAIAAEFDDLAPHERIAKSRAMGIGEKAGAPRQLSEQEKADAAARINGMQLSGPQKMAEARKAGLNFDVRNTRRLCVGTGLTCRDVQEVLGGLPAADSDCASCVF